MIHFLNKGSKGLWTVLMVWILACGLFLGIRSYEEHLTYGPYGRIFADNDGSMRWLLVLRALHGEDTRIRWMHEDNAPHGRLNEWTSPLTYIGAWTTWLIHKFTGMTIREAWGFSGVWMSAWIGIGTLAVASLYAWRMGGGWSLASVWLFAWQPMADWIQMTRLGNPDYHSMHQLLLVVMVLSTYRAVEQLRGTHWNKKSVIIHGSLVGLASAIGIWSGATECMVLVALVYGLGVYEFWLNPLFKSAATWTQDRVGSKSVKKKKTKAVGAADKGSGEESKIRYAKLPIEISLFWLISLRVLTVGLLIAQVYEYWPNIWTTQLEMFSPWHVAAAACTWLCFEIRSRTASWMGALMPGAVSAILLILLAGWMRGWKWGDLHVVQSNYYWLTWSAAVEMRGWWYGSEPMIGLLKRIWFCYGLLIPGFLVVLKKFVQSGKVAVWSCLMVTVLFILSLNQTRWGTFFVIVFVLVMGLAWNHVWRSWRTWHVMAVVALSLPCWDTVHTGIIQNQSVRGRYQEATIMQKASELVTRDAGRKGAIVLAPWHLTPRMICHGQVRTIGSAYWSNLAGLKVSHEIYSTWSESRFKKLLKDREVEYLLSGPPAFMTREVLEATQILTGRSINPEAVKNVALIAAIIKEADYLEPITEEFHDGWKIYRINRARL